MRTLLCVIFSLLVAVQWTESSPAPDPLDTININLNMEEEPGWKPRKGSRNQWDPEGDYSANTQHPEGEPAQGLLAPMGPDLWDLWDPEGDYSADTQHLEGEPEQATGNSNGDDGADKEMEGMVQHDYENNGKLESGSYAPNYLGLPSHYCFRNEDCNGPPVMNGLWVCKYNYCHVENLCLHAPHGCNQYHNGRPSGPNVVHGRPFIVDGVSRTTNSDICTKTDSDEGDINAVDSWRVGSAPSVPPSGKHNHEIGVYWLKQAEAEHASVASFARHTLQLMSKGAPARLLEAAQKAALDEIKHAKMCYGIASAFLGKRIGPGFLDVVGSLENMDLKEIVESLIVEGCFGETLSAIEAHLAAHYAQDEAVQEVLKEIAADETRHGQLAWDTVGWIVKKQSDIQNYVNDVFDAQLKKLVVPAQKNDTSLYGTAICEDSEKEITLHRYGLLNKGDREKVREVGIRDIIEPVYRDGFKHLNSISKGIMELNMIDL